MKSQICMSLSLLVIVCAVLLSSSALGFVLFRLGFFPLAAAAVCAPLGDAESADASTARVSLSSFVAETPAVCNHTWASRSPNKIMSIIGCNCKF